MKSRTKYVGLTILTLAILAKSWVAVQDYQARRAAEEEEMLNDVIFPSVEFEDSTLEQALQQIVETAHAQGYPQLRMQIYKSVGDAPEFHRLRNDAFTGTPDGKFSVRLTSIPLRELLKYVGGLTNSTCELHGHDVIAGPEHGTIRHFQKKTFRLYPDFFQAYSPTDLASWGDNLGPEQYEDMTIHFDQKHATVSIFGPRDSIDSLEQTLNGYTRPPILEELKYEILHWERYPRDY